MFIEFNSLGFQVQAHIIVGPNLIAYLKEPKSVFFIPISSFRVQNLVWLKSVNILNIFYSNWHKHEMRLS
jgi:hypothetical protein